MDTRQTLEWKVMGRLAPKFSTRPEFSLCAWLAMAHWAPIYDTRLLRGGHLNALENSPSYRFFPFLQVLSCLRPVSLLRKPELVE
jgi:hypothetical protein